jgi:uncharacterized protein (TIGR02145 family)
MKDPVKILYVLSTLLLIFLNSCTKLWVPDVTTSAVTFVDATSATCGGTINDEGSGAVLEFGICWGTGKTPTTADDKLVYDGSTDVFILEMTNLEAATTYYVRAFATNKKGTGYGAAVSFTTSEITMPVLETSGIKYVTPRSALSGGKVTVNGSPVILQKGICWDDEPLPDTSDSHWTDYIVTPYEEEYTHLLTDLKPQTRYYVRAYGLSKAGVSFGNELSFTTPEDLSGISGTVTDIEGNIYKTISIGTQVWMAENLKTTKFNDGTDIPLITSAATWSETNAAAYCWYDNNMDAYKDIYGALYKWYTGMTGKLCPVGWHVASDDEWIILESFLGGADVAGIKLKEAGFAHWKQDRYTHLATNESGFTALPSGLRSQGGSFLGIGEESFSWCSSSFCGFPAGRYRSMSYDGDFSFPGCYSLMGGSVRCIRD